MMVGRIGSVLGSNFIGFAMKNYCDLIWEFPAILLIVSSFLSLSIPNSKFDS
jgi:hypothetical protein